MKSILIVDDNDDFRELMTMALSGTYEVTGCASRDEVLSLDSNRAWDAVLLDFHIGITNADKLIVEMREKFNLENARIIMMTGSANVNTIVEKLEAQAYLEKPFSMKLLRETLSNMG